LVKNVIRVRSAIASTKPLSFFLIEQKKTNKKLSGDAENNTAVAFASSKYVTGRQQQTSAMRIVTAAVIFR